MTKDTTKNDSKNEAGEKAKHEEELEKKLSASEKQTLTKENLLTQLLAKDGVQKVLKAEQEGKNVVVLDASELAELRDKKETTNASATNVDEINDGMSNKELAESIISTVSDLVGKKVESSLSGVKSDVDKLSTFRENAQKKEVEEQITKCQQDHPDEFESLQKPMYDTWNRLSTSGPNVEDIFLLAKARNTDDIDKKAETEKPTSVATTTAKAEGDEAVVLPGSTGFRQMLQEVLAKGED